MYSKVYVEITNICNMRCSFCHGHHRALQRMEREAFGQVLDKLTGYTQYIYYHLMGEPLTHPQLPDFIQMATDRGYRSVITTNGTLLPARQDALLEAHVHKVNISLHSFEGGTQEEHMRYLQGLAEFAQRAADAGTIVNFRLWNQGFEEENKAAALRFLQQAILGDWAENTRGLRIRDKIFLEFDQRFAWPDIDASIQGTRFSCYGLRDQFGILVDGTVVPCCLDSEGVIALGNIFQEDLDAILTSARAAALRKGFQCGKATEELCKRCGYAQRFVRQR